MPPTVLGEDAPARQGRVLEAAGRSARRAALERPLNGDGRRAAIAVVALNVTIVAIAIPLGDVLYGKPAHFFREQAAGTYWSGAQLLLVAWRAARAAAAARAAPPGSPLARSAGLVALVAAGFVFLAVDEVARLHEKLEDVLVAHDGPGPKPALLDRIDDLIVLGYGLAGAAILFRARAALAPYRAAGPWLVAAGACFAVMVAADLVTTRDDLLHALARGRLWVRPLWHWLPGVEEAAKLLAEAFLVVAAGAAIARAPQHGRFEPPSGRRRDATDSPRVVRASTAARAR